MPLRQKSQFYLKISWSSLHSHPLWVTLYLIREKHFAVLRPIFDEEQKGIRLIRRTTKYKNGL